MKSVWKDNQRVNGGIGAWENETGECADRERKGRKREKRKEGEVLGWVGKMECRRGWGDSWERRGEWWWWGEGRGTHTPYGGLTGAMWDCSWNEKHRERKHRGQRASYLSNCCLVWPLQQRLCFSTTISGIMSLSVGRHLKLQVMVGVSSRWLKPGCWEKAPSVQPGAQQSTLLPSLCLHSSMTVSHALLIIWIGGCWHQSVEGERKLKINAWESLKCIIQSQSAWGEKYIWAFVIYIYILL